MNSLSSAVLALALGLAFQAHAFDGAAASPQADYRADHRGAVTALLKSIETGDLAPSSAIDPEKYIQHNLGAANGLTAFQGLVSNAPASTRVNTVRVFQDRNYVFAHTDYDFFGPKAGIDVFRFENGKIVEHWDNLQPKLATANPNGHGLFDGPLAATGSGHAFFTARNKALVQAFMQEVIVNGEVDAVSRYVDGERLVQHDPAIADGAAAYREALTAQKARSRYVVLHQVLGDGDFVLAISGRRVADQPQAVYDLFRIANGRIAEHWDVIADIPAPSTWVNDNGKFSF